MFSKEKIIVYILVCSHSTGEVEDERVRLRIVLEAEPKKLHRVLLSRLEAQHGGAHAMGRLSNTKSRNIS